VSRRARRGAETAKRQGGDAGVGVTPAPTTQTPFVQTAVYPGQATAGHAGAGSHVSCRVTMSCWYWASLDLLIAAFGQVARRQHPSVPSAIATQSESLAHVWSYSEASIWWLSVEELQAVTTKAIARAVLKMRMNSDKAGVVPSPAIVEWRKETCSCGAPRARLGWRRTWMT
jgi:hypothetical protein